MMQRQRGYQRGMGKSYPEQTNIVTGELLGNE